MNSGDGNHGYTRQISGIDIDFLLQQSQSTIDGVDVTEADILAQSAGLSTNPTFFKKELTTGGHDNTNHIIVWTKNHMTDRIAELSRNLQKRMAKQNPEHKLDERWDKPKQIGERRRRIVRQKDSPEAPADPPNSAYTVFLSLMTTKIRHDRPNQRHDQTKVVQEISKMWRLHINDEDRQHYTTMCNRIREEHRVQALEFRATGSYTKSSNFEKLAASQLWVHKRWEERNELEREVSTYDTVEFPLRPPKFDAQYQEKYEQSVARRKKKLAEARAGTKKPDDGKGSSRKRKGGIDDDNWGDEVGHEENSTTSNEPSKKALRIDAGQSTTAEDSSDGKEAAGEESSLFVGV